MVAFLRMSNPRPWKNLNDYVRKLCFSLYHDRDIMIHSPTQCNESWLKPRKAVYPTNNSLKGRFCVFMMRKPICSLRFSSSCLHAHYFQNEIASKMIYRCAFLHICLFEISFWFQIQSVLLWFDPCQLYRPQSFHSLCVFSDWSKLSAEAMIGTE